MLENDSQSDEQKRVGRYDSVSHAFRENPWMFKFVSKLCDYYGLPATSEECSSKRERMMYAWAITNAMDAVDKYRVLWIGGFEQYDLELLVPSFIESYRELTGKEVIEPIDDEVFK